MPSGKTHDAVTLILAVPIFGAAYVVTADVWLAGVAAIGFLFGGFMFGPDLDTGSTQYSRWKFLRILWFPYRSFFKHRSRWSHGMIFGTFLRVVYFMGVSTCAAILLAYLYTTYAGGSLPSVWEFSRVWGNVRVYSDHLLGPWGVAALFAGMWGGAASHTFTDMAGTYIKTGRVTEFL